MYVDPTGHSIIGILILLGVMAVACATAAGVHAYNEGARGWELTENILLGGAAGLMVGGAVIVLGAVGAGAIGGIGATIFSVPVVKAFAIGSLAVNFWTYVVLPLYGEEEDGIEVEEPVYKPVTVQPTVPHPAWN